MSEFWAIPLGYLAAEWPWAKPPPGLSLPRAVLCWDSAAWSVIGSSTDGEDIS